MSNTVQSCPDCGNYEVHSTLCSHREDTCAVPPGIEARLDALLAENAALKKVLALYDLPASVFLLRCHDDMKNGLVYCVHDSRGPFTVATWYATPEEALQRFWDMEHLRETGGFDEGGIQ